ncbi:MAG: hypothetical protein J0L77_09810 [Alphaproteobacteria bacterium]|nr:hypothetical protein [Alphaproteobacteria bacterium]
MAFREDFSTSTSEMTPLRPATRAEIDTFFGELKAMKEGLRLDYHDHGCAERSNLIQIMLEQRGLIHGTAHCTFDQGNWHQHHAAFVVCEEDGQRVSYVLDPAECKTPLTSTAWKELWVQDGADPRSFLFLDGFLGSKNEEALYRKLHAWGKSEPFSPALDMA